MMQEDGAGVMSFILGQSTQTCYGQHAKTERQSIPCVEISRLVDRAVTRIPPCWVSRWCQAQRAPTAKSQQTTIWSSSLVFSCQKPNKNGECVLSSNTLQVQYWLAKTIHQAHNN